MKIGFLFLSIMLIIVSDALGACLKKVLPLVTQQTAFVQDRCIGETGRLIYNILDLQAL